jgi:hypothetical protein
MRLLSSILESKEERTEAISFWVFKSGNGISTSLKFVVACAKAGTPT